MASPVPSSTTESTSVSQPFGTSQSREDNPTSPEPLPLAMTLPPEGVRDATEHGVKDKGLTGTPVKGGPDSHERPPQSFEGRLKSHLPTPQSPTNISPYVNGTSGSPIPHPPHVTTHSGTPSSSLPRRIPFDTNAASTSTVRGQMVTPDSSPMAARKWTLPEHPTTPTRPKRKTPPKTPPPPTSNGKFVVNPETPIRAAFAFDSQTAAPDSPSSAQLSSPFAPRASASDYNPSILNTSTSSPPAAVTASPKPNAEPTPEPAPVVEADAPTRPPGGEIERIRMERARALASQQQENEARRPEYLRRTTKRPLETETGFGIAESPMKGRRIELWGIQETSEESFEERLMAGGYGGYGSTGPAALERPRTPTPTPSTSKALEWANLKTPGKPGSLKGNEGEDGTEKDLSELDERELRKRKRLEAFRRDRPSADSTRPKAMLHPVEVEGKGRVLLDIGAEEVPDLLEGIADGQSTRGKKRGGRRKKRGGLPAFPARGKAKARVDQKEEGVPEGGVLNWPDEEFPWSVRTHERREQEKLEEAERMQWIERFLEAESEEESEEEEEDGDVVPMQLDSGTPNYPRGRGKMVPLKDYSSGQKKRVLFPSDPADARAALLSKKSVRALAAKRQFRVELGGHDDDDELLCICRGRDDGRELVQCDDCRTWYHLECIGITIADLGREEDPWYCENCVVETEADAPASEPTFAQAEEEPAPRRPHDPLFYQGSSQESPDATWTTPARPPPPTTPTRTGRTADPSTRSSYAETSASRHGPSTPQSSAQHVRVFTTTPGSYDNIFGRGHDSPFDPTSTPSRGITLGGGAFVTPKGGSGMWAAARNGGPGPFATPTPGGKYAPPRYTQQGGLPRHALSPYDESSSVAPSSSPYRAVPPYDDTPVDRSVARPVHPAKRSMESPLMGRGMAQRYHRMGADESPLVRGKGKERQGGGR
ncbi:hypothetical protein BV25DRAFT_1831871 [Artomyces pyxidatus]|uniref:Uncharacterized protein n=1 Tax=Artomyces pyxidatus TaxID=48021 RepID=A0ACB8SKI8_9AGAM|nr:hypothetical protein BV25DRAFT_1831871 [Artomyces pyxidatus]